MPALAWAQPLPSPEEGAPLAIRHSWSDYDAHVQNWAALQSREGVVFVANTEGVLEYDGEMWRLHALPDTARSMVRSLAEGPDGRVYLGGVGIVGRLVPDSTDGLAFQSLMNAVPDAHREFGDVWTTFSTPRGVVFQSPGHLFLWDGREMQAWEAETSFHKAFQVGEDVVVREEGVGLRRLGADGLRTIPGGAAFADRKVFALLPHPEGFLAAVRDEGLVLIRRGIPEPLAGPSSAYLQQHRPYAGTRLPNPYGSGELYAFATFGGGVLVTDARGQALRVYREDVGLEPDDFVVGMQTDAQGGLWLALLNGLVRVEPFGRTTQFGDAQGLQGQGYAAFRHEGTLYVATSSGVQRLVPGSLGVPDDGRPAYSRFEPVSGDLGQAWSMLEIGEDLLTGANTGVYHTQNGAREEIAGVEGEVFAMEQAPWDDGLVLIGTKEGLHTLRRTSAGWAYGGKVSGTEGEVRSIALDADAVWVGLLDGGVAHVRAAAGGSVEARTHRGDLDGVTVVTQAASGEILASTAEGVWQVSADGGAVRLQPVQGLDDLAGAFSVQARESGGVWVIQGGTLRGGRLDGGAFVEEERLQFGWTQIGRVTEDEGGVLWLLTDDGVLRYDPRVEAPEAPFPAFVRRVADGRRETLYGGALPLARTSRDPVLVLPYAENDVRFEFAAAAYAHPRHTEFQTWLVGQQDEWSPWGRETIADYTNLSEGTYTFRVRARDARGRLSEEGVFVLRVLPPWYRTAWAYAAYLLGGLGLLWGIVALQVRKHRRKLAAQHVRHVRVSRLNGRLQEINARLRRADRLKDDLLANTSHELRTPLTAILGYAELLLEESDDEMRPLAEGVWRGGNRLLSTVNALLDMYKLQSGSFTLHPEPADALALTRETVGLLRPLAEEKGVALTVLPADRPLPVRVDVSAFERILPNLVGNAIKFTDEGSVVVLLDADERELRLTVRDTGTGIDTEFLPHLFEPFEQASRGHGRSHEGTGLGLAIVRHFVELAGGAIEVESEVGEGSTFRVRLPICGEASPAPSHPDAHGPVAFGAAEVLAVTTSGPLAGVLRRLVEPHGYVRASGSILRAVREARRRPYDLVVVQGGAGAEDMRRVAALRRVPGYEHLPIIRAGGPPASEADLDARGFTHQIATLDDEAVLSGLLQGLLLKVEAVAD